METVPKCGAKSKSTKQPCRREAGWGTDHPGFGQCKFHGGSTPANKIFSAKQEAQAALETMAIFGAPIPTDPNQALLTLVNRSAGMLVWLELKIEAEGETDLIQDAFKEGPRIAGPWVKLWNDERDRLAKYCKMALDAGVAERSVRVAEAQGQLMVRLIQSILGDLNLSPEQRELVPTVVRNRLLEMPALEAKLV